MARIDLALSFILISASILSVAQAFVKSHCGMFHFKRFLRPSISRNLVNIHVGELRRTDLFPFTMRLLASKKNSESDGVKQKKVKKVKVSDLNETSARDELVQLNDEINRHDVLYYAKSAPEITDAAYDKLLRRASDIVGRFQGLRSLVSKLDKVGVSLNGNSKFAPFNHTRPMQSLDNAFTEGELESFLSKIRKGLPDQSRCEFVIEPKIDGLSLSLHYVNGELVRAGTRGDGTVGEDVTVNVLQHIPSIPRRIESTMAFTEVRGEVYISKSDFKQLNEERQAANLSVFSTARNAASGSLRRLDSYSSSDSISCVDRRLKFFAYTLLQGSSTSDVSEAPLTTQSSALQRLQESGFSVASPHQMISVEMTAAASSTALLYERCKQLEALSPHWDFDADGVVLKVNDFSSQQALGEGTKAPKWAMAFKFSGDVATTTLEDIILQVGRTGVVTPVARLMPTQIGGVTVERATLHNFNEVRRLSLFKGARVLLKRSGDVIPKILGLAPTQQDAEPRISDGLVSSSSNSSGGGSCSAAGGDGASCIDLDDGYCREWELPLSCPCCNSPLVSDANGTVRCSGGPSVCSAQAIEQISHFCSRDAADIQGLGSSRLEYLYENGYIKSILDLYHLRDLDLNSSSSSSSSSNTNTNTTNSSSSSSSIPSLRSQKGWGDRSVNNLLASIDQSRRTITMTRLLYGLGISQLGLQMAREISEVFAHNFTAFWQYLRGEVTSAGESAQLDRLTAIHGFGPVLHSAVINFAMNDASVAQVEGLLQVLSSSVNNVGGGGGADGEKRQAVVASAVPSGSSLAGRKVVFTGSFECGITRKQAQEMCVEFGGSFHGSVTKAVDLLVDCAGTGETKSEKRLKAEKLGIEVWTEQQWKDAVKSRYQL